MIAQPIRTVKVTAGSGTIFDVLDHALEKLPEKSVLAVTSKLVSLCEGRVRPIKGTDLPSLVREEAEWYMPDATAQHGYTFTIANNMLTPNSGIDESNAGGVYVLWPKDPWASANVIRAYLKKRFGIKEVAVIITDSNFLPLRWGSIGLALSYSGLEPVRSYSAEVDLFGRPLKLSRLNVLDCLATTAVLMMGEGAEQTPMALITDLLDIRFVSSNPTTDEIKARYTPPNEDSFGPLLKAVEWRPGGNNKKF
jgi:F420-0:gamma-glutamyl ligase